MTIYFSPRKEWAWRICGCGGEPLRSSKTVVMFLKLTGSHIKVEVTGKYVNQGAGYGLELPYIYHVSSQEKAVACYQIKLFQ